MEIENEENLEKRGGLREKIEKSSFFWLIKCFILLFLFMAYLILGITIDRLQVRDYITQKGYDVKEVSFDGQYWAVQTTDGIIYVKHNMFGSSIVNYDK